MIFRDQSLVVDKPLDDVLKAVDQAMGVQSVSHLVQGCLREAHSLMTGYGSLYASHTISDRRWQVNVKWQRKLDNARIEVNLYPI